MIAVGKLIRPRGNRGEMIAVIYSTQPGRAERLTEVTLEFDHRSTVFPVEEVWIHDGKPVFKFAGIDSIDEAEEWSGADILVPDSERLIPEPGEYTHADLIGCSVEQPGFRGRVVSVEDFGGPSLLKVVAEDGREILVPFANAICKQIDIASKTIRVELPEGLLEL